MLCKNFDYYVQLYRNKLLESFNAHAFSKSTLEVLHALLLGQRQDMDTKTTQTYTDSGVIHILAISGLHIAILYAILVTITKPLEYLRNGKRLQFLITLLILWCFAILSGLSASVVRSVVMFSFISWGNSLGKVSNNYNTLAVSLLTMLLFKPNFLFDVGCQLSYVAVLSIMWLYPMVRKYTYSRYMLMRYFLELTVLSLVAQIGVLPISLFYFNQFPGLFLIANIVVIPLSSFILIYGILVLAMNFIWLEAALLLGKLLSLTTVWMNNYIEWIASFTSFTLKNISFNALLLLSSYLLLYSLTQWLQQRKYHRIMQLLACCYIFQLSLITSIELSANKSEFLILNNRYSTLATKKTGSLIEIYTNDTAITTNKNLQDYLSGHFTQKRNIHVLKNVAYYNGKKILFVDSMSTYPKSHVVDVLVLTQSPKINLSRLITEIQPKAIVADGSNYKSYVNRWKATCEKEKIPFHATAEKGFYRIN